MDGKEIVEGNRVIARFMGYREIRGWDGWEYGYTLHPTINAGCTSDIELRYYLSWDSLMPVVKEISDMVYNHHWDEQYNPRGRWVAIANELQNVNLENVWFCVVKFIQWYNSLNNS